MMKAWDSYVEALMEYHKEQAISIKRLDLLRKRVNDELDKQGRQL